jgi:hypothetical protein
MRSEDERFGDSRPVMKDQQIPGQRSGEMFAGLDLSPNRASDLDLG